MIGAILFPCSLFLFTWSEEYIDVNWAAPKLSGILITAGILPPFLQALNYLIDAYLIATASAIAANTILRSFFGAGFPWLSRFCLHRFCCIGMGSG